MFPLPIPNRFVIVGVTIAVLLIGAITYVVSLNNTIEAQRVSIDTLQSDKDKLKLEIALASANNMALKNAVSEQNEKVKQAEASTIKIQSELTIWMNKPASIKYVNKEVSRIVQKSKEPTKDICKDLAEITNSIKGLRYEDL